MRITIVNPNTTDAMTEDIYKAAISVASPGTEITAISSKMGPASIECRQEQVAASLGLLEAVHEINDADGADAFIVSCYGDPGLEAVREVTDKPVIGIAQASMYMAAQVAPKMSIITLIPRTISVLEEMVTRYGMDKFLTSIRSTDLTVLDFEDDPDVGMKALKEQSRLAVEEDGAEAILLGCAGMVSFTKELEEMLGVPVFDGVTAAVKMAEGLIAMGKKTSKVCTYQYPPVKHYTRVPEVIKGRK